MSQIPFFQKEMVTPGVPAFLRAMAPGLPMARQGLAKWIVSPANPFTALRRFFPATG